MTTLAIINLIINIINIIFIGILLYIGIQIFKNMPKDPDGSDNELYNFSSEIKNPIKTFTFDQLEKDKIPIKHRYLQKEMDQEKDQEEDQEEDQEKDQEEDQEKDQEKEKHKHDSKEITTLQEAKKQALQNHDYLCNPSVNNDHLKHDKSAKSENCISNKLSINDASDACISASDSNNTCSLVYPHKKLSYQKNLCGDHYYCTVNNKNSCNYNKCDLRKEKKYSFKDQSICQCQKDPLDKSLKHQWEGRMCEKGKNCSEYKSYRKPKELFNFPDLKCWYDACSGPPTWMNVPNISNRLESKLLEAQTI